MNFRIVFVFILGLGCSLSLHAKVYDVTDFGALGDSVTLNTEKIQQAINTCSANGGGMVYFPAGTYLSGTIFLEDNIHLYFEQGATLMGTTDVEAYPLQKSKMVSLRPNSYSPIYAEGKNNITISGNGVIYGQGDKAPFHIHHKDQNMDVVRPKVICMIRCRNIEVKDVQLKNSAFWMQHYLACEDVLIDGVSVDNRYSSVNNDGIDIDCCKNVRIANCNINSEDDAIVMKSTSDKICENVTITNCILSSHCNALKCGTESNGGFRNIAVSNCVIYDTYLSGIALEIVDGGVMDLVNISNIIMHRVNNPLFIKLGNRARPYSKDVKVPGIGEMRNIQISNVQATDVGEFREVPDLDFSHHNARPKAAAVFITGLAKKDIQHVSLQNFFITYKGGGSPEDALTEVPENPQSYPEYSSYGAVRPAYGFYCRNITNLTLKDFHVRFEKEDYRPAYIFDQVYLLQLENITGEKVNDKQPVIEMKRCKNSYLRLSPTSLTKNDVKTHQCSKLIIN